MNLASFMTLGIAACSGDGANYVLHAPESAAGVGFVDTYVLPAGDVFAVGSQAVIHFDGEAWTRLDAGPFITTIAIWATAANDVWVGGTDAGGDSTLLRWERIEDGAIRKLVHGPSDVPRLQAVGGDAAGHVWVVGNSGTILELE